MKGFAWKALRQVLSWSRTCQHIRSTRKPLSGFIVMTAFAENIEISSVQSYVENNMISDKVEDAMQHIDINSAMENWDDSKKKDVTTIMIEPMKLPDPQALSAHGLIRAGTVVMVNAACSVITQTVCALTEAQEDYLDALTRLVKLLELSQKALENKHSSDTIWEAIIEVRAQVQESKEKTEELQYVLSCTQKTLEAAGEAAHMAGADYAGHTASACLNSSLSELSQLNSKLDEAKSELLKVEIETIQVTAEFEAKTKEKLMKDELDSGEDETDGDS